MHLPPTTEFAARPRRTSPPARSAFPPTSRVEAVRRDLERWAAGTADASGDYSAAVERARGHAATLLGVDPGRIATARRSRCSPGSPRHPPPTAPRCCASRATSRRWSLPFLARGATSACATCRSTALADAIARRHVARRRSRSCSRRRARWRMRGHPSPPPRRPSARARSCDTTQAAGWMPTDRHRRRPRRSATRTSGCAPRAGRRSPRSRRVRCAEMRAALRGLVLGRRPVGVLLRARRCTSPRTPRRFDVSPAWQAWVGAEAGARIRRVARRRGGAATTRSASRTRSASGSDSAPARQRDRDVARRRRHRARRALAARASPPRAAPGAPGSRSTSGTTTRTSTSPRRARSLSERMPRARRNAAAGRRAGSPVAAAAQRAARTVFDSVPRPDTVTSTVSPSTMGPTPAGVPVRITSPGSRVNTLDA